MRTKRPFKAIGRDIRRAFSLIELLIVIVIIGILAALILPAVSQTFVTANEAKVTVEIKGLENAIAVFKTKFGDEPPSHIVLCTNSAAWNQNPESKAIIRRFWSNFDFSMPAGSYPAWWDTKFKDGQFTLNSGECLVFFLGGIIPESLNIVNDTAYAPIGFSSNTDRPFSPSSGGRIPPFFEFDTSRLKDTDFNGMPEYLDPLPAKTKRPYLYFSSYGGTGYRVAEELYNSAGLSIIPDHPDDPDKKLYIYFRDVYRQGPNTVIPGSPESLAFPAHKATGFQIISPGYDGEYGLGGVYNTSLADSGLGTISNKKVISDKDAFDNITNFSSGRLKK